MKSCVQIAHNLLLSEAQIIQYWVFFALSKTPGMEYIHFIVPPLTFTVRLYIVEFTGKDKSTLTPF